MLARSVHGNKDQEVQRSLPTVEALRVSGWVHILNRRSAIHADWLLITARQMQVCVAPEMP